MRAIRQFLIPPAHLVSAITALNSLQIRKPPDGVVQMTATGTANIPSAWILSSQTVSAAGHAVSGIPISAAGRLSVQACGPGRASVRACLAALNRLGYRELVTYQPVRRFWAFQWCETAAFLALALALAGFCFWWIRHRLA